MPKVSICIPCYQHPMDVKMLLDSIQEQTFTDVEVILTDDTKEDSIAQLVKEHPLKDKIIYQKNKTALGHIFNWNEALKKATGEYIKIMFSDDWFSQKDSLEKMVRMLDEHPDASLAFTGTRQVLRKSEDITTILSQRDRAATDVFLQALEEDYRSLFLGNEIGAPSATIYRADAQVQFDEQSNWASDLFLYFEILQKNPKFVATKEPLICIGESDTQYTYMFDEYDERKYEDYKYLYQKYKLYESKECREYFLTNLIMPYERGPVEAVKNKISLTTYAKEAKKQDGRYKIEMLGNVCFFLAFFLEMLFVVLDKSAYILQHEFYDFFFTFLLFGVKILCSRYNKKQWFAMFLGAVAGLISYVVCGRLDVLRIVAFGAAASKVPLKSQLRSALAVTGIGCLIVMLLSFFGIGYPIKATELYRGGGIYETRYSWGLGHPNAFHCMFLMLLLLAVAVYFEKMTWYHLLIACILNVVIYRYTDSNFGFCSVMLALVLAVFLKYPCFSFLKKCLIRLRMFWVVVCIGISVYFAYSGAENDTWRRVLDDLVLNGRIQLAYINASPHSWLPFGSSSATEFFDMGWVRVFYWYGWIPALLGCIILLVTAYSLKAEKDKGILLLFLVLVLYTVFEAHIISPYLGRNALIFVCGFYSMRKLKGKEPVFFYRLCKPFS